MYSIVFMFPSKQLWQLLQLRNEGFGVSTLGPCSLSGLCMWAPPGHWQRTGVDSRGLGSAGVDLSR